MFSGHSPSGGRPLRGSETKEIQLFLLMDKAATPNPWNVETIKFLKEYKVFGATCLFSGHAPSGVGGGGRPLRGSETKEIQWFLLMDKAATPNPWNVAFGKFFNEY